MIIIMVRKTMTPLSLLLIAGLLAACSGGAASPTSAPTAAATAAGAATSSGSTSHSSATAAPDAIHLNLVADGTQARYRVREQLAQLSLPSDAVGTTSAVTGTLVINPDGTVIDDLSMFVVDVTGLTSDKNQRDGFVQRSLLQTRQYPTVVFVPTSATGLASPLPTSGALNFQLKGNLTAHGATKPATWAVTGQILSSTEMTGTATTSFTFEDYNIPQPRVPVVLSVVDKITLEFDFHLVKAQ
jgi:polyisoprenoid-binding protein YceI